MAQVFAGFVCGYLLALLSTPLLAIALLRLRAGSELLARLLPPEVPAVGVGVLLHGALFLLWTGLGIVLGLVLLAMEGGEAALGSRNLAFTLLVFGLVLAIAAPLIALARGARFAAITGTVAVVLVFGWLMPHMAEWTRFDS